MTQDEKKMTVDSMLIEYGELRSEIRGCMQLQCTLLTLFVTAIGIVFALLFKTDGNDITDGMTIQSVGVCLIPGISAFCGVLWLDQVFRQVRIGSYIYELEERVNRILKTQSTVRDHEYYPALYWEHCVNQQNTNVSDSGILSRLKLHLNYINPNLIYYYIGLMVFALVPVISWILVYQQVGLTFGVWSILGALFFVCYVIFATIDVVAIIKSRNYDKNNE